MTNRNTLRLTPDDLRQHAGDLESHHGNLVDVVVALDKQHATLMEVWTGPAAATYDEHWSDLLPKLQAHVAGLGRQSAKLLEAVSRFVAADGSGDASGAP